MQPGERKEEEPPSKDPVEALREKVALENEFSLYARYSEKEAAGFVGRHYRTVQRWRRESRFDLIRAARGADKEDTSYIGYEIADILLGRHRVRQDGQSDAA